MKKMPILKYVLISMLLTFISFSFTINDLNYSQQVRQLCAKNGLTFFKHTLKTTVKGNQIQVIGISGKQDSSKYTYNDFIGYPAILITGAMHPRQVVSFQFIKQSITHITKQYGKNDHQLRYLLSRLVLLVIPFVNIDGIKYSIDHPNETLQLRKNLNTENSDQCKKVSDKGVDLNRNFGFNYGNLKTSSNPCSQQYRGTQQFSQLQSQSIVLLYHQFKITTNIDVHSFGNVWIYPYASSSNPRKISQHPLYPIYQRIFSQFTKQSIQYKNCYQALNYAADGVYIDWALAQGSISFALEFGNNFTSIGSEIYKHVNALLTVLYTNNAFFKYYIELDQTNTSHKLLCIHSLSTQSHEIVLLIDGKNVQQMKISTLQQKCFSYNFLDLNTDISKNNQQKITIIQPTYNIHIQIKNSLITQFLQLKSLQISQINKNQPYLSLIKYGKIFIIVIGVLCLIGSLCGLSVFCQNALGITKPQQQQLKHFNDTSIIQPEQKTQSPENTIINKINQNNKGNNQNNQNIK